MAAQRRIPLNIVHSKSRLSFIEVHPDFINSGIESMVAIYKCTCGNVKEARVVSVRSGGTKSCGCLQKENGLKTLTHGLSNHPLFRVWDSMIARCYNKNHKSYHLYGGSGISVCGEWLNDFKKFYDWAIFSGYKKGLQIDKDILPIKKGVTAKEYSPDFCSWVTRKENSRIRRSSKFLEYKGQKKTMSQWAEYYSLRPHTIKSRLLKGWSVENAIETPEKNKQ